MPKTEFLNLEITTDDTTKFENWRKSINGGEGSNAIILDNFAKTISQKVEANIGEGGAIVLPLSEWVGNTLTIQFEGISDDDGIFFGPTTLVDKELSEAAGLFLSSNDDEIEFVCLEMPIDDISLNYFIVRGKKT